MIKFHLIKFINIGFCTMLILTANLRIKYKKNATRKLRQKNECPAIIYGGNHPNIIIKLNQNIMQNPNISQQLYENNVILLNIEQKTPITVKIQTIQHHPFKSKIIHIDFLRTL